MNHYKKIISWICTLCLLAGIVPVQTNAAEVEEAHDFYGEIPLYYQTDYPETMFGTGSVATSGCSITALTMVATYLTGHEYLPDELARYFGGTAENNIRRLEIGSETMQLPFEKSENFDKTMVALREGKVAIALMEGSSLFTTSQHFIVLTGLNEQGKIMVNDPYAPNYERWDLKRAFAEGFEEGGHSVRLQRAGTGAWGTALSRYSADIGRKTPFGPCCLGGSPG